MCCDSAIVRVLDLQPNHSNDEKPRLVQLLLDVNMHSQYVINTSDAVTLNNASDYRANGHYRTTSGGLMG